MYTLYLFSLSIASFPSPSFFFESVMRVHISDGISSPVSVELHPWSYIKDVKDKLSDKLGIPATRQRLFFAGQELKNTHTLNDCSISDDAHLFLSSSSPSATAASAASPLIAVYGDIPCPAAMRDTIAAVRAGLTAGLAPRLAMEGTGGTYFLRSPNKQNVAVFKAEDEEPFAPANPRGYQGVMGGAGFRAGLLSGEGAVREVAAYLMDHDGVSGVPATTRVELSKNAFKDKRAGNVSVKRLSNGLSYLANPTAFSASFSSENIAALARGASAAAEGGLMRTSPSMEFADGNTKIGSLQSYIEYDELAGDVAPQLFPAREVQKIAILDMRLFNIDRNEANILVQRKYEVLPPSQEGSRLPFSPPSVGPSHLHHHRSGFSSGFSPDNPFSFSPIASPASSSASFFDSPTFTATPTHHSASATPLSPDVQPSSIELPPAATALAASFNLNYPSRAHSFETVLNSSPHGKSIMKPTAAIPIPIPISAASIAAAAISTPSFGSDALLSSSVPSNPPSRLQARLQALKAMRQQQSTIKPTIHLIPIDHSYTLPDTLELASVDWCWMDWPQAKEPLVDDLKQYVLSLDVKADIDELRRRLAIREECLKVMRISGMLLQKGVAADLTLYEIGCLTCRQNIDTPSQLEVLCAQAATLARSIKDKVRRGESGVVSRSGWKRRTNFQRDERRGSVLAVIHSQPSSPAPTTEGESSSDSQDSPPQSADSEHSPPQSLAFSPSLSMSRAAVHVKPLTVGSSSLARALKQQSRKEKEEERKPDDEDEDAAPLAPLAQPSLLSRSVNVSSSVCQSSRPSEMMKTLPQPIPTASSNRPSLTRSNSLDLILRRSISYDDFRAVRVNKQGFSTNSITTQTVSERDGGSGSDDSEGDESSPPTSSSSSSFSSPPSQPVSNSSKFGSPPSLSLHDGLVYRVGGVLHLAGEREGRKDVWTSEEQSRLFFSCLSGLMDSAIERIAAQKKDKPDDAKQLVPVSQPQQARSEPISPLPRAAPSAVRTRAAEVSV